MTPSAQNKYPEWEVGPRQHHTPQTIDPRHALDVERLRHALVEQGPYAELVHTMATGSTNTDLVAAAHKGAPAWTVHLSEHQSSGRGRMGRKFEAPQSAQLTLSFLIRPPKEALHRIGTMALATGLALVDALAGAEQPVGLKWPNDLLCNDRKLCGILAEAVDLGDNPAVVIGLGLNTALTEEELPVAHATSLQLEGISYQRDELAIAVLLALHRRLRQWEDNAPQLMDEYRAACTSIGKHVRVILPGDAELLGQVETVNDEGLLLVRDYQHELHELAVGDVVHLRLQ